MTRTRFDIFFPAFRTAAIAGLTLALLGGCATEPAEVAMFGPADVSEIEMTGASLFGPLELAEVEITAATIQPEDTSQDGIAATEVPAEDPAGRAAAAWLAGMEEAAKAVPQIMDAAPVRASTPESYGASGGGVGVADTAFGEASPTQRRIAPRRKSIVSRGPSQVADAGVASIAGTGATHSSAGVSRGVSRSVVARDEAPKPLTPAVIKSSIGRQMGKVRACYERALKQEQGLAGKLVMSWRIGADGVVKAVSVARDELGSDKVSLCVTHAVATFKFPRGTESVSIEYPMSFKSESTW